MALTALSIRPVCQRKNLCQFIRQVDGHCVFTVTSSLDARIHLVIQARGVARSPRFERFIFTKEFTHFWKRFRFLGSIWLSKDLFRGEKLRASQNFHSIFHKRKNKEARKKIIAFSLRNIEFGKTSHFTFHENWKLFVGLKRKAGCLIREPQSLSKAKKTLEKIIVQSRFEPIWNKMDKAVTSSVSSLFIDWSSATIIFPESEATSDNREIDNNRRKQRGEHQGSRRWILLPTSENTR